MDIRFFHHNTHLDDPGSFVERDPHLRQLRQQLLVHRSCLLDKLPRRQPGIYTVAGGCQIGKTTLMKQWMADLLKSGVAPKCIAYLTGELVDAHHFLVRLLTETLNEMPITGVCYLILDEVAYIHDWGKGIKYLADAGLLENVVMILVGSDLAIIEEARMRFAGRGGTTGAVDFHLHPLSFLETVKLKKRFSAKTLDRLMNPDIEPTAPSLDKLYEEFDLYLVHGGFLTAINDMARHKRIMVATFSTYSDRIRGDVLRNGKQEHYLREILEAVVNHYGRQVTWNTLARELSIDHPKTVGDYVALLAAMDAAFVQAALVEDKLAAAPKKARKLMFADPFIFHAARAWLAPRADPYSRQVKPIVSDTDWAPRLAEACVVTHCRRYYPTYYIKAKGEVDVAYVDQNRFWPLEVKWTEQLRPKDLKQIAKYPNGRIFTGSRRCGEILGVPTEPLPLAMLRFGSTEAPADVR
ncbi:MAG: ATP-binding protein [Desulfobacterales bacterium]|nr:ATP-binding protein [Desulfobacterales bacterium]